MERAVQTGTIISEQLNIPLRAFPDIHESGGIYHHDPISDEIIGEPGNSRSFFEENYPDLILPEEIDEKGWWNRDYEKREERSVRVQKVLATLTEWHGGSPDNIIFVSHGGFYNYFMRGILEKEMDRELWFEFYNGAITLFGFDNNHKRIYFCNRYEFMPVEIVT